VKKAKTSKSRKGKKKTSDDDEDSDEDDFTGVRIEMNAHVSLTFSLKYLVNFSKSASLCGKVQLMMSNDVPLLVSTNNTPLLLDAEWKHPIGIVRFRPGIYQILPRTQDWRRLVGRPCSLSYVPHLFVYSIFLCSQLEFDLGILTYRVNNILLQTTIECYH